MPANPGATRSNRWQTSERVGSAMAGSGARGPGPPSGRGRGRRAGSTRGDDSRQRRRVRAARPRSPRQIQIASTRARDVVEVRRAPRAARPCRRPASGRRRDAARPPRVPSSMKENASAVAPPGAARGGTPARPGRSGPSRRHGMLLEVDALLRPAGARRSARARRSRAAVRTFDLEADAPVVHAQHVARPAPARTARGAGRARRRPARA